MVATARSTGPSAPPPTADPNSPPSPFEEGPSDAGSGGIASLPDEPLDAAERAQVRALFEEAIEAFEFEDYGAAAVAFEKAAAIAPQIVSLWVNATTAYRHAAQEARTFDEAQPYCDGARRTEQRVREHVRASDEERQLAEREAQDAEDHCNELDDLENGPCLSIMPCLSPPPPMRGCRSKRNEMAMLGSLVLLGLRSRRRRDAVETVADRLPPDVAERLRERTEPDDESS